MRNVNKPHIVFFTDGGACVSDRHTGVLGATGIVASDPSSASRVAKLMEHRIGVIRKHEEAGRAEIIATEKEIFSEALAANA